MSETRRIPAAVDSIAAEAAHKASPVCLTVEEARAFVDFL